jgi:hypothetical protein
MLLALLLRLGSTRWWRRTLFVCFWIAVSGFFQWQTKTCMMLAADGRYQLSDQATSSNLSKPQANWHSSSQKQLRTIKNCAKNGQRMT